MEYMYVCKESTGVGTSGGSVSRERKCWMLLVVSGKVIITSCCSDLINDPSHNSVMSTTALMYGALNSMYTYYILYIHTSHTYI